MKLYLSSYQIPNLEELENLLEKPLSKINLVLVTNAKDYYIDRARKIKVASEIDYFKSLGVVRYEEIDLRDYETSDETLKAIGDADLVWVMGGNTFMLRHEMNRSGFDDAIKKATAKGAVYGGNSAGAAVAGNTIKGLQHGDAAGFAEEIHWDGLGLVDHFILPHVGNNMYEKFTAAVLEEHEGDDTVVKLTDDQVLIVNGNSEKIV